MPEVSMQNEVMDTHRSVYTQCGATSSVVATVIVQLKRIEELKTQAREINEKRRKKPIRKEGMKTSTAQTEKIRRSGHRKETMTELQKEDSEEEVVVLKVISNIKRTPNVARQARNGENKGKEKLSRQDKLYREIIESEKRNRIKRKANDMEGEKENEGGRIKKSREDAIKRKRLAQRRNEKNWEEKFRQWSPRQDWPITAPVVLPGQAEGFSAFQTSPDLPLEAFMRQAGSFLLPR